MRAGISRFVLAEILGEAAASPAVEVCGLLLGEAPVSGHLPARNVSPSPADSFEIDPVTLFAAIRAERRGGARIAGYYHSHPTGRAEPSPRDLAAAAPDGRLWLIVAGGAARAWRAGKGGFEPVELVIEG